MALLNSNCIITMNLSSPPYMGDASPEQWQQWLDASKPQPCHHYDRLSFYSNLSGPSGYDRRTAFAEERRPSRAPIAAD